MQISLLNVYLCNLIQILLNRGTETEEQIQKRLRNAKGELEQGRTPGLFDHMLVNDNLDACYQTLKVIIAALLCILFSDRTDSTV